MNLNNLYMYNSLATTPPYHRLTKTNDYYKISVVLTDNNAYNFEHKYKNLIHKKP